MSHPHHQHMMTHNHDNMMNHGDAHGHAHHEPEVSAEPEDAASLHGGSHGGHNMIMYFHGGFSEVILFDVWRIDSLGGLIGSMVVIFLLGILYEGLKFVRDIVYNKGMASKVENQTIQVRSSSDEQERQKAKKIKAWIKTVETEMWSKFHFLQTLFHMLQITLSYLLMLIFMTFNTWLCLALVFGLTVGYFLFGWRKTVVLQNDTETCH